MMYKFAKCTKCNKVYKIDTECPGCISIKAVEKTKQAIQRLKEMGAISSDEQLEYQRWKDNKRF